MRPRPSTTHMALPRSSHSGQLVSSLSVGNEGPNISAAQHAQDVKNAQCKCHRFCTVSRGAYSGVTRQDDTNERRRTLATARQTEATAAPQSPDAVRSTVTDNH